MNIVKTTTFQIIINIVFTIAISMALIFHVTLYLLPAVFILASLYLTSLSARECGFISTVRSVCRIE